MLRAACVCAFFCWILFFFFKAWMCLCFVCWEVDSFGGRFDAVCLFNLFGDAQVLDARALRNVKVGSRCLTFFGRDVLKRIEGCL